MRVLPAEQQRTFENAESQTSVDAWLRHALAEEYGPIAYETLPDALLLLLPAD